MVHDWLPRGARMPEDASKEVAAGQRLLAAGDYKGALSRFNRAIKLDPSNAEAYLGKAEAAAALPDIEAGEIVASYQKAIELQKEPGERAMTQTQLGAFCLREGKTELAEECYKKAAELDPENAPYYFSDLGIELYMAVLRGMEDEVSREELDRARGKALTYFARALDLEPAEAARLLQSHAPGN
ncbi:MAG: tetratricopeptide repeat protein [Thermoplasmata archaeon]